MDECSSDSELPKEAYENGNAVKEPDQVPSVKRVTFAPNLPIRERFSAAERPDFKQADPSWFINNTSNSPLAFVIFVLLQSRFIIGFFQALFNLISFKTDAFAGLPQKDVSFFDTFVYQAFAGFHRWDAVHFVNIAENGYLFETSLAFFPLFPMVVRMLTHVWSAPFISLGILRAQTALLVTAVTLNFFCFMAAGICLYHIVFNITGSLKQAVVATILFAFNPASIFFSAAYSESMYCFLTFAGILALLDSRNHKAPLFPLSWIFFTLAFLTRANGLLNIGYVIWFAIVDFLYQRNGCDLWRCTLKKPPLVIVTAAFITTVKIMCCFILMVMAMRWHSQVQYPRFCNSNARALALSTEIVNFAKAHKLQIAGKFNPEWCRAPLIIYPQWYATIQRKYWDVGLFEYWKLRKIPCFLLAAPAFLIVAFGLRVTRSQTQAYSSLAAFILDAGGLFPFAVHAFTLAFGALFFYNVEIFTRMLFSSTPFPYLVLAQWISDVTPLVRLSDLQHPPLLPFLSNFMRRGGVEFMFTFYVFLYFFTGTLLHVTWLPFT